MTVSVPGYISSQGRKVSVSPLPLNKSCLVYHFRLKFIVGKIIIKNNSDYNSDVKRLVFETEKGDYIYDIDKIMEWWVLPERHNA